MTTKEILQAAKTAKAFLLSASAEQKNQALYAMAECLLEDSEKIIAANLLDYRDAKGHISDIMLDRLQLNRSRIENMANEIRAVAELPDPVGRVLSRNINSNGMVIEKISVPFGVIGLIYESRPNVTSDAAALSIKSGNACVLRGGSEAFRSSSAITEALKRGLERVGFPADLVCMVSDTSRASVMELMTAVGFIDLLIPRGNAGLIRACVENAKVPYIETGTGICHVYIDKDADLDMALDIVDNAKTSRPSVCNAAEVCLVHRDIAARFLPCLKKRLQDDHIAEGKPVIELRIDDEAAKYIGGIPAGEQDFDTEFLDYILAVKIVDDVNDAVRHIALHSTKHSDAIVTENGETAALFTTLVDSAAVYVNVSTRFTDGAVFGLGCEIGISTQKLHAHGPMGLEELTTYKYIVKGEGQVR